MGKLKVDFGITNLPHSVVTIVIENAVKSAHIIDISATVSANLSFGFIEMNAVPTIILILSRGVPACAVITHPVSICDICSAAKKSR